jgi:uncharacterized RDD family membrane protein YckC
MAPPLARRMACWLYEGMLIFGVVVAAGLVFSIATDMRHGLKHRTGLIAFLFVVLGLYFTVLWSKGQTLAMQTWKIRIVDRLGRPLTRPRAFMRYVFSYIWLLPPLAAFSTSRVSVGAVSLMVLGWVAFWALLSRFHSERQFLHDALAGTRLLPAEPRKPLKPR